MIDEEVEMTRESRPRTPPQKRNEPNREQADSRFETSSEKLREAQRQRKAAMLDFARQYEKPRERPEDPVARQELYELNGTVKETI